MYVKPKVVYSNVWEDPELNRQSLKIKPTDTVLSITSGGCNSLNLLLEEPARVISIDCNPGQKALLDLKVAAFKELTYDELIRFLGARAYKQEQPEDPEERLILYGRVARHLPADSKAFWDEHREQLKVGVIHCGSVEKFFAIYRRVVKTLYAFDRADRIFYCKDLDEQRAFHSRMMKGRFRFLNQLLLNKFILGLVKGKHSFKYVNNLNFGANFNSKVRHAFQNILLHENYFLALILLGAYTSPEQVPPYLKRENFERMRGLVGRLDNRLATLGDVLKDYGKNSIHKFNLSNIFEWFDEEQFNAVMRDVLDLAGPDARLCYRYTLARPQKLDLKNSDRLISEPELAADLFSKDRAFMYESFHIYRAA